MGQGSNRTHPTCPVTRRQGHERRPRRNDPANEPRVRRAEAANEADCIIGAGIASIGDYRFHEGLLGVRGSGSDLAQRTNIPVPGADSRCVRQGPRHAPGRCDLQSQSRRIHHPQDRDGKYRCGLASAPGPQDAKGGLPGVAKVPRAECAVDLPCVAGRLAIAVYRTS